MRWIAEVVAKEVGVYVHPQDINLVSYNAEAKVYAVQHGKTTILCWETFSKGGPAYVIKTVDW